MQKIAVAKANSDHNTPKSAMVIAIAIVATPMVPPRWNMPQAISNSPANRGQLVINNKHDDDANDDNINDNDEYKKLTPCGTDGRLLLRAKFF